MESEEVETALRNVHELANQAGINGVPFLIINGKVVQSIDKAEIQKAINAAK